VKSKSATKSKTSTKTARVELRGVLIEAARVQLAAVIAATKFWSIWADSADRYARSIGLELEKLSKGAGSKDAVARLADVTREYLRRMTEIPGVALQDFGAELEKVAGGKPTAKRTRSARAKN
jgi:hypothetical protein